MADIETVELVVRECFVYKLPPRPSSTRAYRAADWGLDKPIFTARLKIVSKGQMCTIVLQDGTSGDVFAEAPIDTFPTPAIESVSDSSRYFVIRVVNEGKHAFLGMGFAERTDAFDFNVTLQDFFKRVKASKDAKAAPDEPYQSKHNLELKEGQTFRLNIKTKKKESDNDDGQAPSAPKVSLGDLGGGLQPPPGVNLFGGSSNPPAASAAANPFASPAQPAASNPFGAPAAAPPAAAANPFATSGGTASSGGDDWCDFASGPTDSSKTENWVKF